MKVKGRFRKGLSFFVGNCRVNFGDMKLKDLKFDKVYVITLPHNQERLIHALKQLEKNGVAASPFQGVHAKTLGICHQDERFSPGMVGCFLSHYLIFREAVAAGWDSFLVFEDDMELVPGFESLFSAAYKHLPEDWEFVWLGYGIHDGVDRTKIIRHNAYWITAPSHWGTHAYMVRGKDAIARILSDLETMADQIDLQLVLQTLPNQKIKQYSIYPAAVRQTGVGTDVQLPVKQNLNPKKLQKLWT